MMRIDICLSCDFNYIQHMAVSMASILHNSDENTEFCFHVIHDGSVTIEMKNRLMILSEIKPFELKLYRFDRGFYNRMENVPVKGRFTETVLYRIMAPSILKDISKVLYLDSDIIVVQSIAQLWDTDMDGFCVAAIDNYPFPVNIVELGLPKSGPYFNSGVLLMDLDCMRKENTEQKAIDFIKESGSLCKAPDQDVLNAVFYNAYLPLPPKYNARHLFFMPSFYLNKKLYHNVKQYYGEDDFNDVIHSPVIIHYAGPSKPWHYENKNRLKEEYWKYLRMTPWSEYQYDVHWNNVIEKWIPESFKYYTWNVIMPDFMKKILKKNVLSIKV